MQNLDRNLITFVSLYAQREKKIRKKHTREVPPYDRLERHDLGLAHKHRASRELLLVFVYFRRHRVDIRCDEMVWDDVLELGEPKARDFRQERTLARNTLYWHQTMISFQLTVCENAKTRWRGQAGYRKKRGDRHFGG